MPQVYFVTLLPITFCFCFVFFVGFIIFGTELFYINILDHKQSYIIAEYASIFFRFVKLRIKYHFKKHILYYSILLNFKYISRFITMKKPLYETTKNISLLFLSTIFIIYILIQNQIIINNDSILLNIFIINNLRSIKNKYFIFIFKILNKSINSVILYWNKHFLIIYFDNLLNNINSKLLNYLALEYITVFWTISQLIIRGILLSIIIWSFSTIPLALIISKRFIILVFSISILLITATLLNRGYLKNKIIENQFLLNWDNIRLFIIIHRIFPLTIILWVTLDSLLLAWFSIVLNILYFRLWSEYIQICLQWSEHINPTVFNNLSDIPKIPTAYKGIFTSEMHPSWRFTKPPSIKFDPRFNSVVWTIGGANYIVAEYTGISPVAQLGIWMGHNKEDKKIK